MDCCFAETSGAFCTAGVTTLLLSTLGIFTGDIIALKIDSRVNVSTDQSSSSTFFFEQFEQS